METGEWDKEAKGGEWRWNYASCQNWKPILGGHSEAGWDGSMSTLPAAGGGGDHNGGWGGRAWPTICLHKQGFAGTQPCPLIYISLKATFPTEWQNWVVATKNTLQNLKYLLLGFFTEGKRKLQGPELCESLPMRQKSGSSLGFWRVRELSIIRSWWYNLMGNRLNVVFSSKHNRFHGTMTWW